MTDVVTRDDLIEQCADAADSDFFLMAPVEAREAIERALAPDHDPLHPDNWTDEWERIGEYRPLPPFAVSQVKWALREVRNANKRGEKDEEVGKRTPKGFRGGRKRSKK